MRYWQVKLWDVPSDFRVGGADEDAARARLARIPEAVRRNATLGREVRHDDHYCDVEWLGVD